MARRGIVPILIAGAVVAAAALVLTLSMSTDYEAEAIVFPRDPGFANQAFDSTSYITSVSQTQLAETDLASIDQVARIASEELDGQVSPSQVRDWVEVTDTGTGLIEITATAPGAAQAAEVANAYADAAVRSRRDSQVAVVERAEQTAEASLDELGPGSEAAKRLQRQVDDLKAYRDFQTGNLEQVQEATVPGAAQSKPVISSVVGGGIAGLLLGLAGVLLLDRVRPRLTGRNRAEELFGAPVMATLPGGEAGRVAAHEALRSRLLHRAEGDLPGTVLILPVAAEPAAETARALAEALASGGRRTLLVDARLGGGPPGGGGDGLAQILEGKTGAREAISPGGEGSPDALASGGPREDSATLLDRPGTRTLLAQLASDYDAVVIGGPAATAGPDAIPLISAADMTLALVADGSPEEGCNALVEEVAGVGGKLGGVILIER